ncbi:hypothetical protein PQR53_38115, partial [Paraburkholderia fungorum]|uniref:hypothetical protein n=1 Tax=Paraburkholderia fungorum TaxID=134537 RepID=UPI0038B8FB14
RMRNDDHFNYVKLLVGQENKPQDPALADHAMERKDGSPIFSDLVAVAGLDQIGIRRESGLATDVAGLPHVHC